MMYAVSVHETPALGFVPRANQLWSVSGKPVIVVPSYPVLDFWPPPTTFLPEGQTTLTALPALGDGVGVVGDLDAAEAGEALVALVALEPGGAGRSRGTGDARRARARPCPPFTPRGAGPP